MSIDEIITKAEHFAMNFIAKISDKTEQPGRKQTFFLDNQEELQKYMAALQKIVNSVGDDDSEEPTEDEALLISRASDIITKLKSAIAELQKELTISDSVTEQDTTATLSEETISEAMKNNKTTQEISANMAAIAEQQKAAQVGYNYALMCDGQINLIAAQTKQQLNDSINALANAGTYKDIQLFKMQFTPVPLKKQTVLTV